ncbi:helix-turn-helix domain-containing protein [Bacillus sp. S17B2]|uniref:helix-turn-helix domain-containing protein n=1 Tax=Bacillus sp. S17B2 TaxID=2918907 RepID=UPI002282E1BE|nr:helix-turn-helix domain-containing protein [Bacillus sp. S17B2]
MAKQKRLNYELVGVLYTNGYTTKDIAEMFNSVNGHISKVLRASGVATRKRGEVVEKLPFDSFSPEDKKVVLNSEMKDMLSGYLNIKEEKEIVPEVPFIELSLEDKAKQIQALQDRGLSQRGIAKELGIAQSSVSKTMKKYRLSVAQ